jgi:hypothetical protein
LLFPFVGEALASPTPVKTLQGLRMGLPDDMNFSSNLNMFVTVAAINVPYVRR